MTRDRRSKRGRQRGSAAAVVLVGAGLVGFGVATHPETHPRTTGPGAEPLTVRSGPVAWVSGYDVTRSFVGRVEARQESEIGFEIPGMVTLIAVEEGDRVSAGDVVAILDDARLRARRVELVAARDQASATEQLATLRLRRTTDAHEREAASDQEWDDADKAHLAARASLSRAEAELGSLDVDLEKTRLRSPFDAVVARRYVDHGRVIDAGTPVVRLLERVRPEVRIGIGGAAVDAIERGQHFDVTIRDRVVDGVVSSVLPTRDRAGRGVDVVITLAADLDIVRSGDLARVRVVRRVEERGFWVPLQALAEGTRGLWSLYALVGEPAAARTGLATLRRTDVEVLHPGTDRVFVRGPVADGQPVATGGLHRVTAGMVVRVRTTDAPLAFAPRSDS